MINEILDELVKEVQPYHRLDGTPPPHVMPAHTDNALTAIYEIGLECIGADEPANDPSPFGTGRVSGRNDLRASQRKAWAKACGVAE